MLSPGTYTVDDKKVTMTVTVAPTIQFSGEFIDKDTMSGIWLEGTSNWTWTATRGATSAAMPPVAQAQSECFPNKPETNRLNYKE